MPLDSDGAKLNNLHIWVFLNFCGVLVFAVSDSFMYYYVLGHTKDGSIVMLYIRLKSCVLTE